MSANLNPVKHDALDPFAHGFFTRVGGVSQGIYEGLNCGLGSNDRQDAVIENRARVASAMGQTGNNICAVHQHHSPDCITIDAPTLEKVKADAMVTANPDVILGILTADCQPVLFADPNACVVGAAHAGWKGAKAGVLQNTVDAMVQLGAQREKITAVIGPCISQANYEVGQEFLEGFLDDDPETAQFFINGQNGKYLFNLPRFGLACLRDAGIENAAWTGHCTYADEQRFFSYRRTTHNAEPDYGRQIATISARG